MLRRRPLMRMAATTAVVAGTATAVSGRVGRRQQRKAEEQAAASEPAYAPQPEDAPQPEYAPMEPPAAPAGGLTESSIERLKELAALKEQGVLTEEEFAAQKAKLLA